MKKLLLFLSVSWGLILVGTTAFAQAPIISYTPQANVYTYGTVISNLVPDATSGGGGAPTGGYAISPTLPAGLSFDTTTGIISGTPTAVALAADYNVTASNGSGSSTPFPVNITVNPAPLTITADDQSKTYGAANPSFTVSYSGFVNGDTPASLTTQATATSAATAASSVNTYPITASGAASPNYTFIYNPGTLTVTQATLTVTADNQSKVYGAANPALTVSYSGFLNGDTPASLNTAPTASTAATAASSVGSYPITAGGGLDNNYTFAYTAGTLTVTQATLTVTADNQSKVYGAANPALTVSYSGFLNGDTPASLNTAPTASTAATAASAVGSYPITAGGGLDNNYTFVYTAGALTVTQATLTVTADNQSKVYGAANPALTVSYSGFLNGDTPASLNTAPTASTAATVASAVGSYPITAGGGLDNNYTFAYTAGALTVTQATLTVTADNQSKVYGAANPALTVSYSGFLNGDTPASLNTAPTASTTATAASAVGSYTITASGGLDNNYTFAYTAGALTVTQATLTVTADNQSKVYGAANPSLTVSYSGFLNGDTPASLNTAATASTAATAASAVGSYPITAGGGLDNNYTFAYTAGALTVTQATLTVTADNQSKVYGAANPALTLSYSGFLNGDTPASLNTAPTASTGATAASAVGSYPITAGGGLDNNYTFAYTAGTLSVTQATLTVTADNQSKVYGAANPSLTVSYSGFLNGDTPASLNTAPTASTAATAASAVGSYPITAGGGLDNNYTFAYTAGTLSVTQATLTVTADNQSKVYGAANPALTVSYSGFLNGDTPASLNTAPTASTAATAASSVGSYPITASGGLDNNYTFAYTTGALTVTQATLTVTADNQSKVYGAANPALTVSYSGFLNGDTPASLNTAPTASTGATTASAVGSYPITAGGGLDNNYTFAYTAGTLTVTQATLTVTANNQGKIYGAANPALTIVYSGFLNGDTPSSLSSQPFASTTATSASPVGTYSISVGSGLSSNYTFSYVPGTLTVSPATLTITATNLSKNYGSVNPTLAVTYAGFVNGDTQANLTTQPAIGTTAVTGSPAGGYPITASGAVDANYTISYVAGTLTVSPVALTITATNLSKNYGSANPTLVVTYAGFVNGDTKANLTTQPAISTTAVTGSPVGGYPITASGAVDANYTISYVAGTMTVSPVALTITATNLSKNYGSVNPTLVVTYAGFVNGDTQANLTTQPAIATTAITGSPVGGYPITASGAVDANYTISYVAGTLTVNKVALTITATNLSKNYGSVNPTLAVTYAGFVNGDTQANLTTQPAISTTAVTGSPVGGYPITASGAVDANYTIGYVAGTLTVNKVALTITATNLSKNYGSVNPTLAVTYAGFVNGDTQANLTTQPAISTTAVTGSPVGGYPITASGAVDANYTISYVAGTLTVSPVALTITATSLSKNYGSVNPTLAVTYAGFVNGNTSASLTTQPAISTTAVTGSPVGGYPITASGAVDANYTISYVAGTLTVNPVSLTITATSLSKNYGSVNPTLAVTYAGFVNGNTSASLTTQPSISTTAVTGSPVGGYPITASGAVDANYTISYVAGTLTVNKVALTITATGPAKNYGTVLTAGSTGANFTAVGAIAGETVTSVTLTPNAAGISGTTNAGMTYTVTPSLPTTGTGGFLASNYTITFNAFSGTVGKTTLTATANNQTKTYGSANPALSIAYTGFVNGETVAVINTVPTTSTTATTNSAVGAYPITVTGGTDNNYTIVDVNGTLTITAKALTITATGPSKTYGTALTAGTSGTNFSISAGLIAGQNVTSVTLTPDAAGSSALTAAGAAYVITPSFATGTGGFLASNYSITYSPFNGTVAKATLTATPNNQSRTYGAANPAFPITYTGFQNGDTQAVINTLATATTTATVTSNAGTYPITASGGADNNYTFNYVAGTLTVTQATLNAAANNASRTYGAANPTFTFTYTGFQNGDTQAVLNTQPTGNTTATTTSVPGTYPITGSGGADNNYTFTYTSGTLTVTQAALTITAVSQTRTLGVASALTLTYSGFVNGETSANLTTQPNETTTATAGSPAGSYPITACCAADANYAITYVPGTLTITAAGANAYDWTGLANNNAWNDPHNWEINNFQQTVNYPGSSSNLDIANVGVNTAIPVITFFPIISVNNINIASLTFGNNNAPQNNTGGTLALTINNGLTLAVSGAILQEHSNTGNAGGFGSTVNGIVTTLQGSGFITCGSFTVGDNTLPANFGNTITRVNIGSTTASTLSVTVNGNLTMNSASQGFIIGLNANDAYVSLGAGTLTVTGTVQLTNFNTGFTLFNFGLSNPYSKFSIDLNNTNSPVLNLSGATPVSIASNNTGFGAFNNLVDFNNPVTTPNKTGIVNYNDGSGTQKVYTSADANFDTTPAMYSILTLSNASAKTVDGGTLSTTSDFNSSGGGVSLNTNNPIVSVGGNWTNTATVAEGTGAVGITGNLADNAGGTINGSTVSVATTTITGSATNNGTLTCNKENLTFNGNYTNTATFTAGTGLVSFTGTAQALQDNSVAGTTFNSVTFGNSGLKTMSTISSGFFAVSSTGLLTMAGTATLATGNILTLRSTINGSANVAQITTAKPISGNVNVERFITGIRSYRLLSSPVSTTLLSGVVSMNYLINSCFITGTTGAAGGFDTFPGSPNNPSLYLFRENLLGTNASFTSSNYRGVNNLTAAPSYSIDIDSPPNYNVYDGNGYLFFFRGDRNLPGQTLATQNPGYVPTNTILTATGTLNQGPIPVKQWSTGGTALLETTISGNVNTEGFNLVGNPYASSINWDTYSTTVAANGIYAPGVAPFLYILEPNGNYNIYTANTPLPNHQSSGGIVNSNVIASGQGFFVEATGASPSLTFNEAAKTTAQVVSGLGGNLFLGNPPQAAVSQYIHILMAKDSLNEEGILLNFNSNSSAKYVRGEDAPYKIGSGPGNMYCMSADSIPLVINTLPLPKLTPDIIPLYVSATTNGTYQLNMTGLNGIPEIYDVWLKDAFGKDSVDFRHNTSYSFNILRSDATTYGPKRFTVVIGQDTSRRVRLLSFTATKATNGAEVVWKTRYEANYTYFTVERSNDDGKTFIALGGSVSSSLGTYSFLDKAPPVRADRYRLKIEDLNGTITYSNIVVLIFNKSTNNDINASNIIVYPNPTSGKVELTINQTTVAPEYTIQVTNNVGAIVKTGNSTIPYWQTNMSELMPGTYFIQVISKKDNKLVGRSTVVKL